MIRKFASIFILLSVFGGLSFAKKTYYPEMLKPRLVVMTDIAPQNVEPDDMESAIRLLTYADCFEIEAIFATVGWNTDPYPVEWKKYLDEVIDAYAVDVNNLMKRSNQGAFKSIDEENKEQHIGYWPSAEYIRSRSMFGSLRAGIGVIGEGNDSPGSDLLIKLAAEDDPRPIWIAAWGGANTLAQAIWRVQQTASKDELKRFLSKFRVFTITDQDMKGSMRRDLAYSSHQWLRRDFADCLKFVWDESTWRTHNRIGGEIWSQYAEKIQGHGKMGSIYPTFLPRHGVEGDTPSMMHVMPNGLNDPEDYTQVGWGGYHVWGVTSDKETYAWTNWNGQEKKIAEDYATRFYNDTFNDFASRIEWAEKGTGNHNPVVVVNGHNGLNPIRISAKPGKKIKLNAQKTFDPDGDKMTFKWWQQIEAGTYNKPVAVASNMPQTTLIVPTDASGKTIHIVCEVHDDGPFNLVAYRRIIVTVK